MEETVQTRRPRSLESRESQSRPKAWAPPTLLPEPELEDGYVFRWVRVSMVGQPDPTNTSSRLREGWEPCKAETQPKLAYLANPTGRFPGAIEIGGLMLCKIPEEFMTQRAEYYANQARAQMQSVDNSFMRENDARMPLFNERKTEVSRSRFGKGS
jgi:hypothetical protein